MLGRQRQRPQPQLHKLRPGQARDALSMARRKSSLQENQQPGSALNLEDLDKLAQEFQNAGKKPSKKKDIEPVESTDEEPGPNPLSPLPSSVLSSVVRVCVVLCMVHAACAAVRAARKCLALHDDGAH